MALDPETAAQITAETRESFAQISRARAAHAEEAATELTQVGTQLHALYGATAANMLTGIINQQANSQQALKSAGYFPTVLPIASTPVAGS
jgi:hypothetical protein